VYTWGSGYYGQLAQGTKLISNVCTCHAIHIASVKSHVLQTPEIVEYFVKRHLLLKQIASGSHHCVAITSEGELYSWGSNKSGCLARYTSSSQCVSGTIE
jgi:alpha-tubulin suppressor-like RCC1 family protein